MEQSERNKQTNTTITFPKPREWQLLFRGIFLGHILLAFDSLYPPAFGFIIRLQHSELLKFFSSFLCLKNEQIRWYPHVFFLWVFFSKIHVRFVIFLQTLFFLPEKIIKLIDPTFACELEHMIGWWIFCLTYSNALLQSLLFFYNYVGKIGRQHIRAPLAAATSPLAISPNSPSPDMINRSARVTRRARIMVQDTNTAIDKVIFTFTL